MHDDALSSLLTQFTVKAASFFSGPLCQRTPRYGETQEGHLHLLLHGSFWLELPDQPRRRVAAPTVLLFPHPALHRLAPCADTQPRLACATLSFAGGPTHPLRATLPGWMALDEQQLEGLGTLLTLIEKEAREAAPGNLAVLDRLFEVLLVQLLRQLPGQWPQSGGLLAGLADARLSRALAAIHARPGHPWRLEELAACALLSRARFAARFHLTLGCTPGDYLRRWRMSLVCKGLLAGRPLTILASEVGYESASALTRAFRREIGTSPRAWRTTQRA